MFLSSSLIFISTLSILIQNPKLDTTKVLFETISAFATVGLSTGITADLNSMSKIILILLMIVGKIGVLIIISIFVHPKRVILLLNRKDSFIIFIKNRPIRSSELQDQAIFGLKIYTLSRNHLTIL